jgi:hypothetical protein
MSRLLRATLVAACALTLSGCFKSDLPLFNRFDSVTPVAEGTYSYTDTDKKRKNAIVTLDGTATKFITTKDDGSAFIQTLLMSSLGEGYYIVMDDQSNYGLIRVRGREVLEYDHENNCNDILEIAQMEGSRPSDYGVASVTGDNPKTCKFTSMDNLRRAMETLIERDAIDPSTTYTRQ